MKTLLTCMLMILPMVSAPAGKIREYHAVMTTTRNYMDTSRKSRTEYWFTADKTCISNGRVTTLVRKDLGVVYTLINSSNEYYTDTIRPEKTGVQTVEKPDFRYIGVGRLSTDYDWIVSRKPAGDTSGLFRTACYSADGDADFDQVSLEFFIARPGDHEMARLFNEIVINSNSAVGSRKPLIDRLRRNKFEVPEKIVELIDNPIAPPIKNLVLLEKLETMQAPEGIFDLPAGARQAK